MDIYKIFAATDRAVSAGFFTYQGDADKEDQIRMLGKILGVDPDRVEFCLYLIEVFEDPSDVLDELIEDANAVVNGDKLEDQIAEEYGSGFLAMMAVAEARRLEREEEDDE